MDYKLWPSGRVLLRWAPPRPEVYRFTPQGLLYRYHLRSAFVGREKETIPYSIAPSVTSWRSSRTSVLLYPPCWRGKDTMIKP